jgi:hypothetical protein
LFRLSVDPTNVNGSPTKDSFSRAPLAVAEFRLVLLFIGGWGTSRGALIENGLPGVGLYLGWWHSGGTSGWELCTLRTASWTPVLRGTSVGGIVYAKAGR